MRTHTTNRRGGLLLAGVAAVALMGGSAFTASVTGVENHKAGAAAAGITGIDVTNIAYNLDHTGTEAIVTSLTFTSADVSVNTVGEMSLSNGEWIACTPDATVGAEKLECPAPASTTLASVSSIDLVVTDKLGMTTSTVTTSP